MSQSEEPYKPSLLEKSAMTAFVGTIATWGFYYANTKFNLTSHVNMSPNTYNWTVGGLPEFFGAWFATTFPAAFVDEAKDFATRNNYHVKIIHPLKTAIIAGSTVTTLGILDEMYSFSGGVSDEWDVTRYAAGFAIGLTSTLFYKQQPNKRMKPTLEKLL